MNNTIRCALCDKTSTQYGSKLRLIDGLRRRVCAKCYGKTMPETKFAGESPFTKAFGTLATKPAAPKPKETKPPRPKSGETNLGSISFTKDPYLHCNAVNGSKYDELFDKMVKDGTTMKLAARDVGKVSGAARKYLKRSGIADKKVAAVSNYGDSMGRIWFLKK